MEGFLQDLRFGLRVLTKNPGFTAVAVLTLALGIGANTAIFSVADALVWKPLPIPEPDRVVMVMEARQERPGRWIPVSPANYLDWKEQNQVFKHLSAFWYSSTNLSSGGAYTGRPERLESVQVSADFFDTLAAKPILGRSISKDEEQLGHEQVVILGYTIWQRHFGGDPKILDKTLRLDGREYAVIGVMAENFNFPVGVQLWTPLAMSESLRHSRYAKVLFGVARLKPGATLPRAEAELSGIARRLAGQNPQTNTGWTTTVFPFKSYLSGDTPSYMVMLMGVAGFVLLIACVNVANLQLSRASGRAKEIAVRAALGAGRWRLARQLLAESVLLSALGGALGTLSAFWGVDLLRTSLPASSARSLLGWSNIHIDHRVFAFALLIAVVSGIISGLAPAFLSSKPALNETLKMGGWKAAQGRRRNYLRGALVAAEVALALPLLVGAGLMAKGLANLVQQQNTPGSDKLLTLRVALPDSKYETFSRAAAGFYERVLERVQKLPGVRSAAVATALPHTGIGSVEFRSFLIEGKPEPAPGQQPLGLVEAVSADYFRTLRIPLRAGRGIEERDGRETQPVAVVSEELIRQFWPGENPIGKRLRTWPVRANRPWISVVGVVSDVQQLTLDRQPRALLYVPYLQWPVQAMHVAIESTQDPLSLANAVQAQVYEVDREQPVYSVKTMQQLIQDDVSGLRYIAALMAVFGALAVTLAAVGIYGVTSYSVGQRTREMGIRMALGAQGRDVLKLVVRQGMILILAGVGAGLAGTVILTRLMSSLLYGIRPTDPATFLSVSLGILAVALVASYIPARRATKVDPLAALRHE